MDRASNPLPLFDPLPGANEAPRQITEWGFANVAEVLGASIPRRRVHVVRGYSNEQISEAFSISAYTVEDHLSNIFEKASVRGRRELLKHPYLNTMFAMA